jgi:hypothetical protein
VQVDEQLNHEHLTDPKHKQQLFEYECSRKHCCTRDAREHRRHLQHRRD